MSEPDRARLSLIDDGVGIDVGDLDRVIQVGAPPLSAAFSSGWDGAVAGRARFGIFSFSRQMI